MFCFPASLMRLLHVAAIRLRRLFGAAGRATAPWAATMAEGAPTSGHAASTGHALRAAASRHAVQAAPSRDATATWHATSPPLRGHTPAVPLTIELASLMHSLVLCMVR